MIVKKFGFSLNLHQKIQIVLKQFPSFYNFFYLFDAVNIAISILRKIFNNNKNNQFFADFLNFKSLNSLNEKF